jgi:hypothetical protein
MQIGRYDTRRSRSLVLACVMAYQGPLTDAARQLHPAASISGARQAIERPGISEAVGRLWRHEPTPEHHNITTTSPPHCHRHESPDMNPIEEIWRQMKSNIYRRSPRPTNMAEPQAAVREEWDVITPEESQALISPMPRCIAVLLEVNGGIPGSGFFFPLLLQFVPY